MTNTIDNPKIVSRDEWLAARNAKQFQQQGLKSVVHLVQFVDQQNTGPFTLQRAQKRPGAEELLAVHLRLQGFPINADGPGFEFDAKPLPHSDF
jgi:hypothetical protein